MAARAPCSERVGRSGRGNKNKRKRRLEWLSLCFSLLVPSSSLLLSCLSPSACLPGSWSCLLATPSISVHQPRIVSNRILLRVRVF